MWPQLHKEVRLHQSLSLYQSIQAKANLTLHSDTLKRHVAKHRGSAVNSAAYLNGESYSPCDDALSGEGAPVSQDPHHNGIQNSLPSSSSPLVDSAAGLSNMTTQEGYFSGLLSPTASLGSLPSLSEYHGQDMVSSLFEYSGYDLPNFFLMAPFDQDSPMYLDGTAAQIHHPTGTNVPEVTSKSPGRPPSCHEESSAMVHPSLWSSRPSSPQGFRMNSWHDTFTPKDSNASAHGQRRPAPVRLSSEELSSIEDHMHVAPVPEDKMARISTFINQQNRSHTVFQSSPAPIETDPEVLGRFVQLYFEYFHPIMPILHKPTFNKRETPWLLVLAVATVGGQSARGPGPLKFVSTLREYLRRAVIISVSSLTFLSMMSSFA